MMGYTELLQVNHCRICFAIVIVNMRQKAVIIIGITIIIT
jgi:hypothetical protein